MSKIEFLSGSTYTEAIRRLIKSNSELKIAVSYWSNRSLRNLEITKRLKEGCNNLKVICDLFNPACRLAPIEELHNREVPVKRIEGLHAKVWISNSEVIVGSANSSLAALPSEGEPWKPNVEAGVWTTNEAFVETVQDWFNELWSGEKSEDVTKRNLECKKRMESDEDQADNQNNGNSTSRVLHPFSYYIGDEPALTYQRRLAELEFAESENLVYTKKYEDIQNIELFADRIVEAISVLIACALRVNFQYSRGELIPTDFLEVEGHEREILHQHISEFIQEIDGRYLWIERGSSERVANYRMSLASKNATKKNISIMSLMNDRVFVAGNR